MGRRISPLRAARRARLLSQGRLEKMTGIAQSTIARLEQQQNPDPRLSTAVELSVALATPIHELFPKVYARAVRFAKFVNAEA